MRGLKRKFIFVISCAICSLFFLNNAYTKNLIGLKRIARKLSKPVYITHAGDGSNRLFIVEKAGRVTIFKDDTLLKTPFLDIEFRVFSAEFETGLLSIAFHPNYTNNQRFFISYNIKSGDGFKTVIAEYQASMDDPDIAEIDERIILEIGKHASIHQGGQLQFGPDGFLYISVGDGGFGGDDAQNKTTLFGSILRIDVDGELPFSIPPDNPFVGKDGRDEIWAYGFRNPWRFSFDRVTGRLFLGDVGQSSFEEVDLVEKAGNYGWNVMEGSHCFPPSTDTCNQTGLILPITDYSRSKGSVVIGGYVYRGAEMPGLFGKYLFGDFASSKIWSLEETSPGIWKMTRLGHTHLTISSFGEDEQGELYVTDHCRGTIHKIIPKLFRFNCEHSFQEGPSGLVKLVLDFGENEGCVLKLTDFKSGTLVEIATKSRTGFGSSIKIDPIKGVTDANGEFKFTISAIGKGIDWVSWTVPNENGEFEFSKKAYDIGLAWGMFVMVK